MAENVISPKRAAEKLALRRERERLRMRARRAANPGAELPYKKAYREKTKEQRRDYAARWYAAEKERSNAISRAYYAKNREELREKSRVRKAADPVGHQTRLREWHIANRERRLVASREKDATPEYRARRDAYYAANKILWRVYAANRRARKKGSAETHVRADVADLFTKQRGRCGYCRKKLGDRLHVDHIIPLARGGSNGKRNLQLLCQPCNSRKSAKHPIEFAQQIGLLL